MEDNESSESLSLITKKERFTHPSPQKTVTAQSCELSAAFLPLKTLNLPFNSRTERHAAVVLIYFLTFTVYVE